MAEIQITKSKQVLVEGRTPSIFFSALARFLNLTNIEIQNFKSNQELSGFLQVFTSRPEFKDQVEAYAIIRDAEQNPAASAFNSVCHSIQAARHPIPNSIGIFTQSTPKVGVFILPDCSAKGMLETLCLESVMTKDLETCIESYFGCTQGAGIPAALNKTKAFMRAYLATQNIDEAQVGRAAQKGIWDWNHPAFNKIQEFLKLL